MFAQRRHEVGPREIEELLTVYRERGSPRGAECGAKQALGLGATTGDRRQLVHERALRAEQSPYLRALHGASSKRPAGRPWIQPATLPTGPPPIGTTSLVMRIPPNPRLYQRSLVRTGNRPFYTVHIHGSSSQIDTARDLTRES